MPRLGAARSSDHSLSSSALPLNTRLSAPVTIWALSASTLPIAPRSPLAMARLKAERCARICCSAVAAAGAAARSARAIIRPPARKARRAVLAALVRLGSWPRLHRGVGREVNFPSRLLEALAHLRHAALSFARLQAA